MEDIHVARRDHADDVVFLPELPMTATGKIHKLTLRERFRDWLTEMGGPEMAPQTPQPSGHPGEAGGAPRMTRGRRR